MKYYTSGVMAAMLILSIAGCHDPENRVYRLLYNSDGTNIFMKQPVPISARDVYQAVDEVAGTQVTTFLICPNAGQNMYFRGVITPMLGEEDYDKILSGELPIPEHLRNCVINLRNLVDNGNDPIGLVVERAREKGLEAFITFRMNELHDVTEKYSVLHAPFWKEHPEYRLNDLSESEYGNHALDYGRSEVRDYYFSLLKEVCERYSPDGLELDFQRFPHYFSHIPGAAWEKREIMTDFLRRVRKMTDTAKSGRLLLAVRIPSILNACRTVGLDIGEWIKEGLIDFVTAAPFLTSEFNMDVKEFRNLAEPYNIPVYTGLEFSLRGRPMTKETFRAAAMNYLDQGADGLYLFNFFCYREIGLEPDFTVLDEIGRKETLLGREKQYEAIPISRYEQNVALPSSLPAIIKAGDPFTIDQYVADDPGSAHSVNNFRNPVLRIVTGGVPSDGQLRVRVNDKELSTGRTSVDSCLFSGPHDWKAAPLSQMVDFSLTLDVLRPGNNVLTISMTGGDSIIIQEIQLALK